MTRWNCLPWWNSKGKEKQLGFLLLLQGMEKAMVDLPCPYWLYRDQGLGWRTD